MKPYALQKPGYVPRLKTNESHYGRIKVPLKLNEDGKPIADKTAHMSARPGAKEKIRNANRALNKRARQHLKKQIETDE